MPKLYRTLRTKPKPRQAARQTVRKPHRTDRTIRLRSQADQPPKPALPTRAQRLHKLLSQAGVSSRRKAETLIQAGKVQVNGQTITRLGTSADPRRDTIVVDAQPVSFDPARLYFLLNKPTGVVSTLADPEGRPTVRELLAEVRERIFPVGRLDYYSAGLLLLTNDGELTARLLHPRYQIPRTYHVKLTGRCLPRALARLKNGVPLADGRLSGPVELRTIRRTERKTWIELTLHQGRHHEVRQMCEAIGYPVEKLIRVRFGPIVLSDLVPGAYRPFAPIEVQSLKRAVGLAPGPK